MTATDLANIALAHLGVNQTIASTSDSSREAASVALVYDHVLRGCLRRFPWSFATKYAELSLVRGPLWQTDPAILTRVQAWDADATYTIGDVVRAAGVNYYAIADNGDEEPPDAAFWSTDAADAPTYANGDWLYAYRYPADCLKARRLVNDAVGRTFSPSPYTWRRGRDENGLLIYTNQPDAVLEYTMLDCADLWSDDLFLRHLTWSLAAELAPTLERAQKTALECLQMAEATLNIASVVDLTEQQQEDTDGTPVWLRNR